MYRDLTARYAEPWRHYHVLSHVAECLQHFDRARRHAEQPDEVEIAIWFHDVVYQPGRPDNEAASAAVADEALAAGGVAVAARSRVSELILATRHDAIPQGADARLIVDVDLAILGADPYRFGIYDRDIRREFAALSEDEYRRGRSAVLRSFLARQHIYQTEPFQLALEAQARANLSAALAALEAPAGTGAD